MITLLSPHSGWLAQAASAPAASWRKLLSGEFPTWAMPALATTGIVMGLAIIILQLRADRRTKRSGVINQRVSTAPPPGVARASTAPPADPSSWGGIVRDAQELIDHLATEADARTARLETLLARAEQVEARLADAMERARLTASALSFPTAPAATTTPSPASSAASGPASRSRAARPEISSVGAEPIRANPKAQQQRATALPRAAAALAPAQPGEAPGCQAPLPGRPITEVKRPLAALGDEAHAEIYKLADVGLDAAEIGRRLNRPAGEIELILGLRPR